MGQIEHPPTGTMGGIGGICGPVTPDGGALIPVIELRVGGASTGGPGVVTQLITAPSPVPAYSPALLKPYSIMSKFSSTRGSSSKGLPAFWGGVRRPGS